MPTGCLRMLIPQPSGLAPSTAERAYMSGYDQIPWPCRVRLTAHELVVERAVTDSGRLNIPWRVAGHGEVICSTGTLMERERPYHLVVELARGKINQVRNQLAEWQGLGLVVTPEVERLLHEAIVQFTHAATQQHLPQKAAEKAQRALTIAHDAADALLDAYVEQALQFRHRQHARLPTLLGAPLNAAFLDAGLATQFSKAFNLAQLPMIWKDVETSEGNYQWDVFDRQIEWCQAQGMKVLAGPLLRVDDRSLPDWLCLWEGDLDSLMAFLSDYVETVVGRYRDRVDYWLCAARMNVGQALALSEEERLRLAVRALETTRRVDPKTPVLVRFDQPWAEYMGRTEYDLSPLHFADALVRAELRLAGIALELNLGYHSGGTFLRDRLELSRMLDLWSCLQIPLHVMLAVPSDESADPQARNKAEPLPGVYRSAWTPESQADWIREFLPLLLAKPNVHSVTWGQLTDGGPHELAHGGLVTSAGAMKPAFEALARLRKKHLH